MTGYDGPSRAGAGLEASPWAAVFNSSAITLDGPGGTADAHRFTGPFSIFFRLKYVSESAEGMLASNQTAWNTSGNTEICPAYPADGGVFMRVFDDDNNYYYARVRPGVALNTWFDLVCMYNGNPTAPLSFYVNGQPEIPRIAEGTHSGALRSHGNSWSLGARNGGGRDKLTGTHIESAAFFDGILTASEIRALSSP